MLVDGLQQGWEVSKILEAYQNVLGSDKTGKCKTLWQIYICQLLYCCGT
jgi:hypothetical protein